MKLKRLASFRPAALLALGVLLGRGAQADTVVTFNGMGTNITVPQAFAANALNSSSGVSVVGFGTPNIGLSWEAIGGAWQFYNDAVWAAGQLDASEVGDSHQVFFTPNHAAARAVVKSFNFHPYYDSTERFTYDVSVLAGGTVVSGPTTVTFLSDGTKNHPVPVNYTGAVGEALELRIERVASTLGDGEIEGDAYDIAVDDITFAQDPATALGGPAVESVSPVDEDPNAAAIYSYHAGIRDAVTAVVAGSIQLKLDGSPVVPAPIISSAGGLTQVNFQAPGLLEGGTPHTYTLTYDDNGVPAVSYTHEVNFTAANYVIVPPDYANPSGSGSSPGFTYRTVLAALEAGAPNLPSTIARAKEQLEGTLIDPATDLPFENAAQAGPNPDGSFNVATVLDFDDEGVLSGKFKKDARFPGLPTGTNNSFSTVALLYLDLAAGYYRFGVNSDDGFEVSVGTPAQGEFTSQTVLGFYDNGRAADDTLFDFVVPTSGLYRFQVIYFETGGSASCEFYSAIPGDAAGKPILINDPDVPNSIKSFRVLTLSQPPTITSVVRNGSDLMIQWVDGVPPFQVQLSSTLATAGWSNSGPPTANRTVTVPMQPGAGFVRVVGQ